MIQSQFLEILETLRPELLDILTNAKWKNEKEAQRTMRNMSSVYQQLQATAEDILPREIAENYKGGMSGMFEQMTAAGLFEDRPDYDLEARVPVGALLEMNEDMLMNMGAALRTAEQNSMKGIRKMMTDYQDIMRLGVVKGQTRKDMTARALEMFELNGFTGFVTKDGKQLPLDFYAQTLVRTNLKKAQVDGSIKGWQKNGGDLFTVSGHTPTCSECYNYRGIVFSASGQDIRFPSAASKFPSTVQTRPPYHPNCMCSVQPVVEKYMTDDELVEAMERGKLFNKDADIRPDEMKDAYKKDQALKRRLNTQKKDYLDISNYFANNDGVPKTLGAYRRALRKDPAAFDYWKSVIKREKDRGMFSDKSMHNLLTKQMKDITGVNHTSLMAIDNDVLAEYNKGFETFFNEFPEMKGFTNEIEWFSQYGTYAHYDPKLKTVDFRESSFTDRGFLKMEAKTDANFGYKPNFVMRISDMQAAKGEQFKTANEMYKSGMIPRNGNIQHGLPLGDGPHTSAIHEMSHAIERKLDMGADLSYLRAMRNDEGMITGNQERQLIQTFISQPTAKAVRYETEHNLINKHGFKIDEIETFRYSLGAYAQSEPGELMAQALSSALGTSANNPYALEMVKVVKKKLVKHEGIVKNMIKGGFL